MKPIIAALLTFLAVWYIALFLLGVRQANGQAVHALRKYKIQGRHACTDATDIALALGLHIIERDNRSGDCEIAVVGDIYTIRKMDDVVKDMQSIGEPAHAQ